MVLMNGQVRKLMFMDHHQQTSELRLGGPALHVAGQVAGLIFSGHDATGHLRNWQY